MTLHVCATVCFVPLILYYTSITFIIVTYTPTIEYIIFVTFFIMRTLGLIAVDKIIELIKWFALLFGVTHFVQ